MDNDWDLYDFLESSAAVVGDGGEPSKDGFLNDDPFPVPISVDATVDSAAGGLEEKLQLFRSLYQRQMQILREHNEMTRIGLQAQAARLKRKKQTTMEVRMKVEMAPKDSWTWRKYGQKPIKGSPNPRSYYRCSSSKLCAARKQVEVSQDNPNEYIVSYIGNHTHTHPKAGKSTAGTTGNPSPPCSASSAATAAAVTCLAPTGENKQNDADSMPDENEEEKSHVDDDIILIPNNQIAEELFMAMHGFNPRESQSPANNFLNSGGN